MEVHKCIHNKNGLLEGPLILKTEIFKDERGSFTESWNMHKFNKIVNRNIDFVQDNQSISDKGVLRGMHFQITPLDQGKLVRCISGKVFDVIIDLRKKSDTFGLWAGIKLDALNANQLWIPSGFAHGFLSLERNTVFQYKVTNPYSKKHERSLIWNDSKIKVKWPEINGQFIISKKDLEAPSFETLEYSNALF